MQERYLGDSHDFVKYSLLRFLASSMSLRLGINWYLTCHQELSVAAESGHGEKRHHLLQRDWSWDDDLKERLAVFKAPERRSLKALDDCGVLPPGTLTFADPVPPYARRAEWSATALERMHDADLMFLDPDVGMQVQSMTTGSSSRYAFFSEIAEIRDAGKIAVAIQFARQCDPVERARSVRGKLAAMFPEDERLPVLRARTTPNVLFLFSAPVSLHDVLRRNIHAFAALGPKRLEVVA